MNININILLDYAENSTKDIIDFKISRLIYN